MTDIVFYRLAAGRLPNVLPVLLEKSLAQGQRAVVRISDDAAVSELNRMLWVYRDDSFLPHGCARDDNESAQPIWLTSAAENPNQAELLVVVDGAEPFALENFKRCLYLFDGDDAAAVSKAQAHRAGFSEHNIASWRQVISPQGASSWAKDEGA